MLYRFEEFELSEEEFALSRDGKRIAIEPRALRVLLVLVENPAKLLEKKALLEAVWKDTFVEETTLTRAIAVIRRHLDDDPRAPRFVETVPTRGYRFIAPVVAGRPAEAATAASLEPVRSSVAEIEVAEADVLAPADIPQVQGSDASRSRLRWPWLVAGAGAVAAGFALLLHHGFHRTPPLSTKDTLVLADFANTSGDPVFDGLLRQGMMVQLEQSPVLRLASEGQIRKTLELMGLPPEAPLTARLSREVCQRLGGDVVLDGSISRLGSEYVLGLHARRCGSGDELDAEQVQVARKEDALNALTEIATRFRTRIGEAGSTLKELDTPLAEATTSSLDALKAFSQGIRSFNTKGSSAALPLFQHATELDPQFAMAYVWLGRMYADLDEEASSRQSTQQAFNLRERASERERFSIDVSYDLLVSGNLEKARSTCDAWILMYPRDVYPRLFLSGLIDPAYGQHEKAVEEAERAIAIDPDSVLGYRNAVVNLINLDRLDDADRMLQRASERKLFLPSFVTNAYRVAFLRGDAAGMKRAADLAPANPWLLEYRAATLAQGGRLVEARALQDQAVQVSLRGARHELQAELQAAAALTEMLYGYPENAARQARAALQLSKGKSVQYAAGLVLAMTANSAEAARLAEDLGRRFPEDTLVRYEYVPTIKAALALQNRQSKQTVDLLQGASQYEWSQAPYPAYLRGQSFLAMGEPLRASTEFQKIIDHRGLLLNDSLMSMAQLHLARSYALAHDAANARAAYDAVLERWKNADPGLGVVAQARRERAAL